MQNAFSGGEGKKKREGEARSYRLGWVGLKQARPELGKRDRMKSLPCFSAKLEKKRGKNMQCTCRTCMITTF